MATAVLEEKKDKASANVDLNNMLHLFSVEDYHKLAESGVLKEDDRIELIEGRIVEMSPIGSKHSSILNRLNNLFSGKFKEEAIISVQNPIVLPQYSEPQPDMAILKFRLDFYWQKHPEPDDILFLIEVADTSADYDRLVKIPLYAKSSIQEVWLIDLTDNAIEVYRKPSGNGYDVMLKLDASQIVMPEAFSDISFAVREILGL